MATMVINNNSYVGQSITITNGKVIVDGKDVTPESKQITIKVEGNINELRADSCSRIEVVGNVSSLKTQSGDVEISGNVSGSVQTMSGDIECCNIGGSVSTQSGDISKLFREAGSKFGGCSNISSDIVSKDIAGSKNVIIQSSGGSGDCVAGDVIIGDKIVYNSRK